MPSHHVTHIREQGVDLVIIEVDPSFATKSNADKERGLVELRQRAKSAGFMGFVTLVWEAGAGMGFYGPPEQAAFYRGTGLARIRASRNKTLSW